MASRPGIVLAGGASSRMGRDKAWIEVDGETLAARTARVVGAICDPVVVVGAPGRALPPLPPGVVTAWDDARFAGPLAGIAAGLAALPPASTGHLLIAGVDMPHLRVEPLAALLALAEPGRAVALEDEAGIAPLPAWLPLPDARGAVTARRSGTDRSLRGLLEALGVRRVARDELLAARPELSRSDPHLASLADADDATSLARMLERRTER